MLDAGQRSGETVHRLEARAAANTDYDLVSTVRLQSGAGGPAREARTSAVMARGVV